MPIRKTINSNIHALKVYPALNSEKTAMAQYLNVVFEAGEAINLGNALVQGASKAKVLTIRVTRKPAVKTGKNAVSVTYETRMEKAL